MRNKILKNKIVGTYDSIAREYDYFMTQTNHQLAQEKILQMLHNEIKGKVLDVATGTGFLALNIKANCKDVRVVGIDISKKMISRARFNAKRKGLKIKFLVADAEKLNFPDKSFDTVICSLGFLWFLDKDSVLKELTRVVKRNGRIIIIEEEGETVRSKNSLKKFSKNLQKFFSKIEKLETFISIKKIKKKIEKLSLRLVKEYRVPIDQYHSFVGMILKV